MPGSEVTVGTLHDGMLSLHPPVRIQRIGTVSERKETETVLCRPALRRRKHEVIAVSIGDVLRTFIHRELAVFFKPQRRLRDQPSSPDFIWCQHLSAADALKLVALAAPVEVLLASNRCHRAIYRPVANHLTGVRVRPPRRFPT